MEDCLIIIKNKMSKKNVNLLSKVPKHEILNSKNMHIVTRQGTKIGEGNQNIIKVINKQRYYPNLSKHKEIVKDACRIIEELAKEEDK